MPGVAKAAFKMMFKKKKKPAAAGGVSKSDPSQETKPSKSDSTKAKNQQRAKKIVAAVAATSLAAVTAYAVAKKTTKMRDDYRAQAKDIASDYFWSKIKASKAHLRDLDEVTLDRKDPTRRNTPS